MHDVASLDVHVRVAASPAEILAGVTDSDTVGDDGVVTVTVTVLDLVPPSPVHVNVKLVVTDKAPVAADPLVARAPLQPPLAVHAVASLDDHVRAAVAPAAMLAGLADSDTVGDGETVPGSTTGAVLSLVSAFSRANFIVAMRSACCGCPIRFDFSYGSSARSYSPTGDCVPLKTSFQDPLR